MLTRLLPDQISRFWDVIKYAIEESLPPVAGEGPGKMNRILMSLLSDKAQCWASYTVNGERRKFEGIVITRIMYDDVSDTRNLLIYCLYGYEKVERSSWLSGFKTLAKYAASRECDRIVGYTDLPLIIKIAERFGGEARYTFVSIPLYKNQTKG